MSQYQIPAPLLQDIVFLLESVPAKNSRHLLNAIESITQQQDREREVETAKKDANPIKRNGPSA